MTYPLAIGMGNAQGKSIELVYSDLFLIIALSWGVLSNPSRVTIGGGSSLLLRLSAASVILFGLLVAGVSCISDGDTLRVISAIKFLKPIMFVFAGIAIACQREPIDVMRAISLSLVCLVTLLGISTILEPSFPYGRWGQRMFFSEAPIYGFPNMSQSFFAATGPLILALGDSENKKSLYLVSRIAFACVALLVIGSMSRSSSIVLGITLIIYLTCTGRTALAAILVGCALGLVAIGTAAANLLPDNYIVLALQEKIEARVDRTFDGGDAFSGRPEIWRSAAELIFERPIFGYGFESFSNHATHDTPHQQYLEMLYKFGGVGFLLYIVLISIGLKRCIQLQSESPRRSDKFYFLGAFIAFSCGVLIGNMTQPNLTYSLTGNFMFFGLGLIHENKRL